MLRRISTKEYVEKRRRCALVNGLFEILNPGVVKELTKFIENTKNLAEWAKAEKLCSKSDPSCWTNFIVTFKL